MSRAAVSTPGRSSRYARFPLRLVLLALYAVLVVILLRTLADRFVLRPRARDRPLVLRLRARGNGACFGAHFPGPTSTAEPPSVAPILPPVNPVAGTKPDEKLANSLACGSPVWPVANPTSLPLAHTPVNRAAVSPPVATWMRSLPSTTPMLSVSFATIRASSVIGPARFRVSRGDAAVAGPGRNQGLPVEAVQLVGFPIACTVIAVKVPVTGVMLLVGSNAFATASPAVASTRSPTATNVSLRISHHPFPSSAAICYARVYCVIACTVRQSREVFVKARRRPSISTP